MFNRYLIHTSYVFFALLLAACNGGENDGEIKAQTQIMISSDGFAIQGYDPVAYFRAGSASKGSEEYSAEWNDAKWLFSSDENRTQFLADPERFAPQYGGWCAYGMAEGYAAETDPENAWAIHEGKLFLNWDEDVASDWQADKENLVKSSEENWPTVRSQLDASEATVYWHSD